MTRDFRMIGFDADDTLWRSEDYFRDAQLEFERIIAAYNAGPGAVSRYDGVPPYAETKTYLEKVQALYFAYRAALSPPPQRPADAVARPDPAPPTVPQTIPPKASQNAPDKAPGKAAKPA